MNIADSIRELAMYTEKPPPYSTLEVELCDAFMQWADCEDTYWSLEYRTFMLFVAEALE